MLGLLRWTGDRLARVPRAAAAVLAAGWGVFVWWLSSGPPPEVPLAWRFAYVFNLAHAPMFGVLALLAALALPRAVPVPVRGDPTPRRAGRGGWPILTPAAQGIVLALVVVYAAIDEWHQASTPGRTSTWHDVVTDVVGAAATLAVAGYLARRDARAGGLWARIAAGVAACCGAAWIATVG